MHKRIAVANNYSELCTLADVTRLLDAERKARQRKKRRRNAQQVQAELRMHARYVNEERLTTDRPTSRFSSLVGERGERKASKAACATMRMRLE